MRSLHHVLLAAAFAPGAVAVSLPAVAQDQPKFPSNTPRPTLNQLSREVGRILALPDIRERLHTMGFAPAPTTPEEQDRMLRADIETFARVAKLAGLRAQ